MSTETQAGPAFPFPATDLIEPPAEFGRLRESAPVCRITLPTGDRAWLVTRHEDVKTLLMDRRFSRAAASRPGAPAVRPVRPDADASLFSLDPPEHTRLRRLVSKAFTPARIERLRPRVQELTHTLIDGVIDAGRPGDLIEGLAAPLPMLVICEILGVPYADRADFRRWTERMLAITAYSREEMVQATHDFHDYLGELIAAKRHREDDDLLGALIAAQEDGAVLSDRELITFGNALLSAGHHTTVVQLGASLVSLLRHPDQLELLVRRPELMPTAVDELLRFNVPAANGGLMRIATEDVEIAGTLIRAGEGVLPAIVSANRDGSAFDDADRLDVTRTDNPHLTFGHGIHYCLGAQLARLELGVAVGTVLRRLPGLRFAGTGAELTWKPGMTHHVLVSLPVTWQ